MKLIYKKFTRKLSEDLIQFLLSEEWKYHGSSKLTRKELEERLKGTYYTNRKQVTFLIYEKEKICAFLKLDDLINDETEAPKFDIRINSKKRGKGYGLEIISFMINYIFKNYPKVRRIEGSTREDNVAMQNLFSKAGFLKAGQFRKAWHDDKGNWYDCLEYDFLREDLEK